MEGIARWLLMIYLPILAPLVLLTMFTWPWKLIGHSIRGIVMGIRSMWRGYSRSSSSHRHRPFSFWRNVYLCSWLELTRRHEARLEAGSTVLSAAGAGPSGLPAAFADTLLEATDQTRTRLHSEIRSSLVTFGIFTACLFIIVVRPSHVPKTTSAPVDSAGRGGVAVDLAGCFSGLAFIFAVGAFGTCAQLATLLSWTATPQQLYWFIVTWERALAGRQLATSVIVTLALAAALAAAYQLYAPWVFIVLLFAAATTWYSYLYFWSDSMWCPYTGTFVNFSQAYHREVVGVESLAAKPSFCAFWDLEPVYDVDVRGSLYDKMHRHLWRERQLSYYVSAGGGGGDGGATRAASSASELGGSSPRIKRVSSPLAEAVVEPADAEHSSSAGWPFMRYTGSSTSTSTAIGTGADGGAFRPQPQGRFKKSSASLRAVSEAGGGYRPSTAATAGAMPL